MQIPVFPCIAECVHNHSGVVYKCYIIDQKMFVHPKPSFEDVTTQHSEGAQAVKEGGIHTSTRFHSIKNMPCASKERCNFSISKEHPVWAAAQLCSEVLKDVTDLTLFGFDLVRPSIFDHFLLVDVNAFPSFKGTEGAAEALRDVLVGSSVKPGTLR